MVLFVLAVPVQAELLGPAVVCLPIVCLVLPHRAQDAARERGGVVAAARAPRATPAETGSAGPRDGLSLALPTPSRRRTLACLAVTLALFFASDLLGVQFGALRVEGRLINRLIEHCSNKPNK